MRRAVALAQAYSHTRHAMGARLIDKPLHVDTLAEMASESAAAFLLAFRVAELSGRAEARVASEAELELLRVLTPITKLTTGKQVVAVCSEAVECFGGAGYVEDTGLPRIVADAQVLPIWEGTTNVLSVDTLRALAKPAAVEVLLGDIRALAREGRGAALDPVVDTIEAAVGHAAQWLAASQRDRTTVEAGARQLALTLGRSYEAALLVRHAARVAAAGRDARRATAQARRFARAGLDRLLELDPDDALAALGPDPATERVAALLRQRLSRAIERELERLTLAELLFDLRSARASLSEEGGLMLG
jgi:hypothetical protein